MGANSKMVDEKNHTQNNHEEDLNVIRDWLEKQPHLPQNIGKTLLLRFLHTCNYSLEQTKSLIDLFYTIRSQAPEIFENRDPTDPGIQRMFEIVDMAPLPKLREDGCKLLIYRIIDSDPDKFNFVDSLRAFFMMADTRLAYDTELSTGEIPIFDMQGYSLRHLTKVQLPILKKYMTYTQEAHPIKLKQIHLLNVPSFLDRCLAILKPFMKSEVAAMLHFHLPNSETLYEFVPKELLPEEYGGKTGKIADIKREWVERVMKNKNYFTDQTRWRVDESRRPIENTNRKQLFGIQGSFRSLNID